MSSELHRRVRPHPVQMESPNIAMRTASGSWRRTGCIKEYIELRIPQEDSGDKIMQKLGQVSEYELLRIEQKYRQLGKSETKTLIRGGNFVNLRTL